MRLFDIPPLYIHLTVGFLIALWPRRGLKFKALAFLIFIYASAVYLSADYYTYRHPEMIFERLSTRPSDTLGLFAFGFLFAYIPLIMSAPGFLIGLISHRIHLFILARRTSTEHDLKKNEAR